jgi:transposase
VARRGRPARNPEEAFWRFVHVRGPDDCWLWTGGTDKSQGGVPYGRFWIGKRAVRAHRYALELVIGEPVPRNRLACHTCDVPLCCNPRHLYVGTTQTNAIDREDRRRRDRRPGERHHNARLTEADVLAIRAEKANGGQRRELADRYGVGPLHIDKIVRGETWKTVGGPITPDRPIGRPRKLTEDGERSIRKRYAAGGVTQNALAAEFGISQLTVSRIVRR